MYQYKSKSAEGYSTLHKSDMDVDWYELHDGNQYIATFTDHVSEEQMKWICDTLNKAKWSKKAEPLPSWVNHRLPPNIDAWDIDKEIAESSEYACTICGSKDYHFDSHYIEDHYLAFSVCNVCGNAFDF